MSKRMSPEEARERKRKRQVEWMRQKRASLTLEERAKINAARRTSANREWNKSYMRKKRAAMSPEEAGALLEARRRARVVSLEEWTAKAGAREKAVKRERDRLAKMSEEQRDELRMRCRTRARMAVSDPERRAKRNAYMRQFQLRARARRFGLEPDALAELIRAQGDACAICRERFNGTRHMCMDHCHATGELRGPLCSRCNLLLGLADDSTSRLDDAADYLRTWRERMKQALPRKEA